MSTPGWYKVVQKCPIQFGPVNLQVVKGSIPSQLKGTLFRNGPANFSRGNSVADHWFQGDGAILSLKFENGICEANYKFIQTKFFKQEKKQDKYLYSGFGRKLGYFQKVSSELANPANTSVLPLQTKLLALYQGGFPFQLKKDLSSIDFTDLGFLKKGQTFAAHYKVDPDTGEIYNFGIQNGYNCFLHLYYLTKNGSLIKKSKFKLRGNNLTHDIVLAGDYLIFIQLPFQFKLIKYLCGNKGVYSWFQYNPNLKNVIWVFKKHDLTLVTKIQANPFFFFHIANGYQEGDDLIVQLVTFQGQRFHALWDFIRKVPKVLENISMDQIIQGHYQQLIINIKNNTVLRKSILKFDNQFPIISDNFVGKKWKNTYMILDKEKKKPGQLCHAVCKYNRTNGQLTHFDFGIKQYPCEPILLQTNEPQQGYLITVVFDGEKNQSLVHLVQTEKMQSICTLKLPYQIPQTFHGKWDKT